ncbi:FtsB family cell division protein [Priestia taiwanensis]|uniref:Septum formation initiator n=1 Tax=Priestia taiwanensis TaxID=1347902 RepID=A0A917AXT5_9BACI|nr:septum formation initiator family protein [Priestia taiwanensis]MBM7365170.1 cell division protein DivIC [Priestia taiwanensis]GGE84735.1 hypothetical protein GCM10007140_37810 [Priestia taiwanensis]
MTMLKKNQPFVSSTVNEEQDYLQQRLEKKKRALLKRLSLLGGLALVLTVFFAVSFYLQHAQISAKAEKKKELEAHSQQLGEEAKELQLEKTRLSSDEYIVNIARYKYLYSKEGETIYSISEGN